MDIPPVTITVPLSQVTATYYAGSMDEYMAEQRENNRARNAMSQTFGYNSDAVNVQISQSNSAPVHSPNVQAALQAVQEHMMAQHGQIYKTSGTQFESVMNRFLALDIMTDEGDKIEIRSEVRQSQKTKDGQVLALGGMLPSANIKIKGELNEVEQKDIQDLVDKVNKVVELTEKVQSGKSDVSELELAIKELEAINTNQNSLKSYSAKVEVDAASGYAPSQQITNTKNPIPYYSQTGVKVIHLADNYSKTNSNFSGNGLARHLDHLSSITKNMLEKLRPDFEGELRSSLIKNSSHLALNLYSSAGNTKLDKLSVEA